MFLYAHRGASAEAPENTLAAFRRALAVGADGIELDVHLSADGVPVVIHDETLERTTDGAGPVSAQSLAGLASLDAGGWFAPEFSGEGVPTLAEVLRLLAGRLRLNLEVKDARAGWAVLDLLRHFPQTDAVLSSFDHSLLARLRRIAPDLPLAMLVAAGDWHRTLAKAALEASVRYLAAELGEKKIRVNAISAGPIRTLAASAVGDFKSKIKLMDDFAPLRRTVTQEEVGKSALYFLSDLASGVTGEIHYVDGGFNIVVSA
jgi:glycerophosphoryl diester phosphodiesterase